MEKRELDAVRQRIETATEGPWDTAKLASGWHVMYDGYIVAEIYRNEVENAEFIAHAREDIPKLLAEIDRLNAELQNARTTVTEIVDEIFGDKIAKAAEEIAGKLRKNRYLKGGF